MSPVLKTLADLVRINSINSSYEGGPGEAAMAAYVRRFFEERGMEVWEQEVFPGRNNVIARMPGRDSSRRIVFEAHMDTVSIKGMTIDPFDPVVKDGRLHGRGSVDDKAGLAAMMQANEIDLAIMGRPPKDLPHRAEPFARHPHVLVTAPDHPFVQMERVPAAALAREPRVLVGLEGRHH